ncbi:MAG: hypothetical protein A3K10_01465 [Bacteroidetes bacterium RIFCSPLOWO2_12_FULL_31_6]|nr:MAG: hypothetical protein A3K10_01465 [Bacteroidetes bacterium RIFCSPLOWO2_12_FULL_31_6]
MIQRPQSVYFAIASIFTLLLLYVNISFFSVSNGYAVSLNALGLTPSEAIEKLSLNIRTLSLTITTIISGFISLVALFLYKNRSLQIRLARITIVLLATIIAQSILLTEDVFNQLQTLGYEKTYYWGFAFPFISIALIVLALLGVKKDEALIKSMDRIR